MSKIEDKSTATEDNNDLSQERNADPRVRFWKVSSYLQLIAIATLIVTLTVTMEVSVSSKFIFWLSSHVCFLIERKTEAVWEQDGTKIKSWIFSENSCFWTKYRKWFCSSAFDWPWRKVWFYKAAKSGDNPRSYYTQTWKHYYVQRTADCLSNNDRDIKIIN